VTAPSGATAPGKENIRRRRDLASSLNFPADLRETFGKFTDSERAVLKIISGEVVRRGVCTLTKGAIADLSSVSFAVAKTALRTAKAEGLIVVERTGRLNTITLSAKWKAWLDRGEPPATAADCSLSRSRSSNVSDVFDIKQPQKADRSSARGTEGGRYDLAHSPDFH
jgi:hypothetical protein